MPHVVCPCAIVTKYLGPTDLKGARVVASCRSAVRGKARIIRPLRYELSPAEGHATVARELAELMEWPGRWYGGDLDERSYVWVRAPGGSPAFVTK